MLSACLGPMTLDQAVLSYNEATTDALSKQLLLNIARARHHQPMHFTAVSNIAATFNFQLNAGATPALTGDQGGLLAPLFGGSVSENPTISLIPVEGEEFTKRLLAPFQENKMTLLLRQGVDIDLLLRMLAEEFRMNEGKREIVYHNRPSDRVGYPMFRRIVLHLSSIQDRNSLYVEPLMIRRDWVLPAEAMTLEGFRGLRQEGYSIEPVERQVQYRLSKDIIGHIVMTNFDPDLLSQEERVRLDEEAETSAPNEIILDVRPGYAGGSYPLKGKLRLRGFHKLLTFLGHSIHDEPEYHVDKDPRTPSGHRKSGQYHGTGGGTQPTEKRRHDGGVQRPLLRAAPRKGLPMEPQRFSPALYALSDDSNGAAAVRHAIHRHIEMNCTVF
ncbi:MAG: hypothetical protein ACREV4_10640 [Gammaproteobacteria bacterium]